MLSYTQSQRVVQRSSGIHLCSEVSEGLDLLQRVMLDGECLKEG